MALSSPHDHSGRFLQPTHLPIHTHTYGNSTDYGTRSIGRSAHKLRPQHQWWSRGSVCCPRIRHHISCRDRRLNHRLSNMWTEALLYQTSRHAVVTVIVASRGDIKISISAVGLSVCQMYHSYLICTAILTAVDYIIQF